VGSSVASEWSTQLLQLSEQSEWCSACAGPRCSTQPGQVQSKPHVQPVPASDAIAPSGGMTGKSGRGTAGRRAEVEGMERIGGRDGPLCSSLMDEGLLDLER
jgi:hypothetical protein